MRNPSLIALALLAGCTTAAPPAPPLAVAPPPPPGMELLLARAPDAALGLLGTPRLDKREGIARLLQFAGGCVLDLWYYPQGGALAATHADARRPDGRDMPAGECLQQLIRAQQQPAIAPAAPPPQPEPAAAKRRR